MAGAPPFPLPIARQVWGLLNVDIYSAGESFSLRAFKISRSQTSSSSTKLCLVCSLVSEHHSHPKLSSFFCPRNPITTGEKPEALCTFMNWFLDLLPEVPWLPFLTQPGCLGRVSLCFMCEISQKRFLQDQLFGCCFWLILALGCERSRIQIPDDPS